MTKESAIAVIFIIFSHLCFGARAYAAATVSYSNVSANYEPVLFVGATVPVKDLKSMNNYSRWVESVKMTVNRSLAQHNLKIKVEYDFDLNFDDLRLANERSEVVGMILIGHGAKSYSVVAGDFKDKYGNSLVPALAKRQSNLRSIGMASCHSSEVMEQLIIEGAFAPFTHKVSFEKEVSLTHVVPDVVRSVVRQLKRTEGLWQKSKIVEKADSIEIVVTRRNLCQAGELGWLSKVFVKIGSSPVGAFNEMSGCGVSQQIKVQLPKDKFKQDVIYLTMTEVKGEAPTPISLGVLEISPPLKLLLMRDSLGHPIGKAMNIYKISGSND